MRCALPIMRRLALGVCVAAGLAISAPASAQLMPYPEEECGALAKALEKAVPLPAPFTVAIEWFSAYDLGIKGRRCRIDAGGRLKDGGSADNPLVLLAEKVEAALAARGWESAAILARYRSESAERRAFAMRRDRVTCRVQVMRHASPAGPGAPFDYTLEIGCFMG